MEAGESVTVIRGARNQLIIEGTKVLLRDSVVEWLEGRMTRKTPLVVSQFASRIKGDSALLYFELSSPGRERSGIGPHDASARLHSFRINQRNECDVGDGGRLIVGFSRGVSVSPEALLWFAEYRDLGERVVVHHARIQGFEGRKGDIRVVLLNPVDSRALDEVDKLHKA